MQTFQLEPFGDVPFRLPLIPEVMRFGAAWNAEMSRDEDRRRPEVISALLYAAIGLCWGGDDLGWPMGRARLYAVDYEVIALGEIVYDALLRKGHVGGEGVGGMGMGLIRRMFDSLPTVEALAESLGNTQDPAATNIS